MRTTYQWRSFKFSRESGAAPQVPKRIVVHRQGNPGAKALNALNWGNSTGAFTIHRYIEDDVVYGAIPLEKHAYHVLEPRIAEARGYRANGAYGRRGDYDSIGIETVDLPGGGPGQAYSLSQETRISLVLVCATLVKALGLTVADIDEHAAYDPWTRKEDLGDALYIPDLRLDVQDHLDGREPWRTVQQFAYGKPAPETWKPAAPAPTQPDPTALDAAFRAGYQQGITYARQRVGLINNQVDGVLADLADKAATPPARK